jgi:hypothetical protein
MSLTAAEEKRIENLEETVQQLSTLISHAGSKSQLNKLLVLCNEEVRKLTSKVDSLEAEVQELLTLARRLQ